MGDVQTSHNLQIVGPQVESSAIDVDSLMILVKGTDESPLLIAD